MAEMVNLRRARKAKRRAKKEAEAESNRATFGTAKVVRTLAKAHVERDAQSLDSHRLDEPPGAKPTTKT